MTQPAKYPVIKLVADPAPADTQFNKHFVVKDGKKYSTGVKENRIPFHDLVSEIYKERDGFSGIKENLIFLNTTLNSAKKTHNERINEKGAFRKFFILFREKVHNLFQTGHFSTSANLIEKYITPKIIQSIPKDDQQPKKPKDKKKNGTFPAYSKVDFSSGPPKGGPKKTTPTEKQERKTYSIKGTVQGVEIPDNIQAEWKKASAIPLHEDHLQRYGNNYERIKNINDFKDAFTVDWNSLPKGSQFKKLLEQQKWDLQNPDFQNLALRLLDGKSNREIHQMFIDNQTFGPICQLIRARTIAIATRPDLDYDGTEQTTETSVKEKIESMQEVLDSITPYDFVNDAKKAEEIKQKEGEASDTKITVMDAKSDEALAALSGGKADCRHICVPNFANAHHTGGGVQTGVVRAQEEWSVSLADHLLALWSLSSRAGSDAKDGEKGRIIYNKPIPDGGAIMHKAHFLLNKDDKVFTAWSNTVAFADFRQNIEQSAYHSTEELKDSFDFVNQELPQKKFTKDNQGRVKTNVFSHTSEKAEDIMKKAKAKPYVDRVKQDIRGYLLAAKDKNIKIVMAGASGSGAFQHIREIEALAWKEVLEEDAFKNAFEQVVFAVPDMGDGNLKAFRDVFSPNKN